MGLLKYNVDIDKLKTTERKKTDEINKLLTMVQTYFLEKGQKLQLSTQIRRLVFNKI